MEKQHLMSTKTSTPTNEYFKDFENGQSPTVDLENKQVFPPNHHPTEAQLLQEEFMLRNEKSRN